MKQKIVIRFPINESRAVALKTVDGVSGYVESATFTRAEMNQVKVVGEGVDAVELMRALRKKLGHADLVSVVEVDKKSEEKKDDKEKKNQAPKKDDKEKKMKQKIVIRFPINKSRAVALKTVDGVSGHVESVTFTRVEMNQVKVVGEGVDAVELTRALRKKLGHADLVSVVEIDKKSEEKKDDKEKKNQKNQAPKKDDKEKKNQARKKDDKEKKNQAPKKE